MLKHHKDRAGADLRRVAICFLSDPSSLLKLMVSDKLGAIQSMSLFHLSPALLKRPWKLMLKTL
jgi:hypothetical protein